MKMSHKNLIVNLIAYIAPIIVYDGKGLDLMNPKYFHTAKKFFKNNPDILDVLLNGEACDPANLKTVTSIVSQAIKRIR